MRILNLILQALPKHSRKMLSNHNPVYFGLPILLQLFLLQEISAISCLTPLQQPGQCVTIKHCPILLSILRKQGQTAGEFLRNSVCRYEDKDPIVCCPTIVNRNENDNINSSLDNNNQRYNQTAFYGPLSPPVCGFSNVSYSRVVGGVPAEVGDWPWISALGYGPQNSVKNMSLKWLCGGSLISSRHLLTAGHCVYNRQDLILVRLGDLDLFTENDNANPIEVFIERFILHPNYSATKYTNDIAILRLKENISFSVLIHPICLPTSDDIRNRNFAHSFPFIAGWGSIYFNGPSSNHLQELQIPVVQTSQCQKAFQQFKTAVINEKVICAGYSRGGKDACQGDSGGPLMFPKETTFYLIGIVSYGFRCAEPGFPGVYTRVTAFLDFIQTNLS